MELVVVLNNTNGALKFGTHNFTENRLMQRKELCRLYMRTYSRLLYSRSNLQTKGATSKEKISNLDGGHQSIRSGV